MFICTDLIKLITLYADDYIWMQIIIVLYRHSFFLWYDGGPGRYQNYESQDLVYVRQHHLRIKTPNQNQIWHQWDVSCLDSLKHTHTHTYILTLLLCAFTQVLVDMFRDKRLPHYDMLLWYNFFTEKYMGRNWI